MGVYIKGMEMPKDIEPGLVIEFADGIDGKRYARLWHYRHGGLTEWLEAVPVPPHGRLIDADALIAEQRHLYCENCARRKGMKNGRMKFVYDIGDAPCRACGYGDVLDDIDDAPTIIPASEEGE